MQHFFGILQSLPFKLIQSLCNITLIAFHAKTDKKTIGRLDEAILF